VRLARPAPLPGRLVRRYKRFLADIVTDDGDALTVHCPDPGSMRGCARPGARVRCSVHDDPRRKLRHTLEMIRVGRTWVGVNTLHANRLARLALEADAVAPLGGYAKIESEVSESAGSRLDFRLTGNPGDTRPLWIEVKSVTFAEGPRGLFPDAKTERGRRHVDALAKLSQRGSRAALLFLVQRSDCDSVSTADAIDPAFGHALRSAADHGVELYALGARVDACGIAVERELPVIL